MDLQNFLWVQRQGNQDIRKSSDCIRCSVDWTPEILVWLCKYSFLKIEEVCVAWSPVLPPTQTQRPSREETGKPVNRLVSIHISCRKRGNADSQIINRISHSHRHVCLDLFFIFGGEMLICSISGGHLKARMSCADQRTRLNETSGRFPSHLKTRHPTWWLNYKHCRNFVFHLYICTIKLE